jgi:hypothetical protein
MSELDRRALLGAAGLVGVAALASRAKAGPLTPPPGPVGQTGRTTDEIFNKIPAPGTPPIGAFDGRTPIGTAPFTIGTPGSYVLTANLSGTGTVITISADDVTLDLNGFTVNSSSTTAGAVVLSGSRDNITVRNGRITGGSQCIAGSGTLTNILIEDICAMSGRISGFSLNSTLSRNLLLRRCQANNIGSTTIASDGNLSIFAFNIGGSCSRVEDCTVSRMFYNGGGTPTLRGIIMGGLNGNAVARCTVSHDSALTATGIAFANVVAGVYRDNTVINFAAAYVLGTNGGGNV